MYHSWAPCPKCQADSSHIESTPTDWGCRACGARWTDDGTIQDTKSDPRPGQAPSGDAESHSVNPATQRGSYPHMDSVESVTPD